VAQAQRDAVQHGLLLHPGGLDVQPMERGEQRGLGQRRRTGRVDPSERVEQLLTVAAGRVCERFQHPRQHRQDVGGGEAAQHGHQQPHLSDVFRRRGRRGRGRVRAGAGAAVGGECGDESRRREVGAHAGDHVRGGRRVVVRVHRFQGTFQ